MKTHEVVLRIANKWKQYYETYGENPLTIYISANIVDSLKVSSVLAWLDADFCIIELETDDCFYFGG